jgi:hypothetical protein
MINHELSVPPNDEADTLQAVMIRLATTSTIMKLRRQDTDGRQPGHGRKTAGTRTEDSRDTDGRQTGHGRKTDGTRTEDRLGTDG